MHYRQGNKDFPVLYHAHHARHSEDIPFWLRLAAASGPNLLELGCGSGRVLLPLAAAGGRVTGLDLDAKMLRFLVQHLPDALRSRVQIIQADLRAFHLATNFDLILLPCNTLSTLLPAGRRSMLGCIQRHLRPGGRFAASLPNPTLLRSLPSMGREELEDSFSHPEDGHPVQVRSAWERHGDLFTVTWHYDHLQPDGAIQRTSTQITHSLENVRTYQDEIQQAGLEVESTLGDYTGGGFHKYRDEQVIFVARQPQ